MKKSVQNWMIKCIAEKLPMFINWSEHSESDKQEMLFILDFNSYSTESPNREIGFGKWEPEESSFQKELRHVKDITKARNILDKVNKDNPNSLICYKLAGITLQLSEILDNPQNYMSMAICDYLKQNSKIEKSE